MLLGIGEISLAGRLAMKTFQTIAPIPNSTYNHVGIKVGDVIYNFGGLRPSAIARAEAYKYQYNQHTQIASMPATLRAFGIVSVETDIYIINGLTGLTAANIRNTLYKYNTLTNTYTQLSNTPVASHGSIAFYNNGYIYLIGGSVIYGSEATVKIFYRYNIANDTWEQLPDFPFNAFTLGIAGLKNNKLYLLYGRYIDPLVNIYHTYDIETGIWESFTPIGDIPDPRRWNVTNYDSNNLLLCTGVQYSSGITTYSRSIYTFEYDKLKFTKVNKNYPIDQGFSALFVIDKAVYMFGGTTGTTNGNVVTTSYRLI